MKILLKLKFGFKHTTLNSNVFTYFYPLWIIDSLVYCDAPISNCNRVKNDINFQTPTFLDFANKWELVKNKNEAIIRMIDVTCFTLNSKTLVDRLMNTKKKPTQTKNTKVTEWKIKTNRKKCLLKREIDNNMKKRNITHCCWMNSQIFIEEI